MVPVGKLPETPTAVAVVSIRPPPTLPPWDEESKQMGALSVMKDIVKYAPLLNWLPRSTLCVVHCINFCSQGEKGWEHAADNMVVWLLCSAKSVARLATTAWLSS